MGSRKAPWRRSGPWRGRWEQLGRGKSRLREWLQNGQTPRRRESWGCRVDRGRAGRDTHPARLHLGEALLPDLLILQADPHHAVHVVGVSTGGEKNTSAALPEEGRSGGGVSHLVGSGFSPAKCLQSRGHLHQGVLSPSPQSPQYPKTRTSNEQPQFSVLIPTPESVSRLMKLFQGSCTERQNSNQVRIKRIYRSGLGGIP